MTTYCDVIKDCTQCPRYAKDCDGRPEEEEEDEFHRDDD